MNDQVFTVMFWTVVFAIVFLGGSAFLKRQQIKKFSTLLAKEEVEECLKLADSTIMKYLFPPYNLEHLKLNAIMIRGKKKEIMAQYDRMLSMRLSDVQKENLALMAFNYYVKNEEKGHAEKMLDIIKESNNDQIKKEAQVLYDIFLLKKFNYIEEMEKVLDEVDMQRRQLFEYLLYIQYTNKKDLKKAAYYEQLYKKQSQK